MSQPTHKVIIHRHAKADLEQYDRFVWKNGSDQASAWYERFVDQQKSLDRTPERCPIARESKRVFFEVRELPFGRRPNVFRVLFTIDGDAVRILRIVRAQRRSPSWRTIEGSRFQEC